MSRGAHPRVRSTQSAQLFSIVSNDWPNAARAARATWDSPGPPGHPGSAQDAVELGHLVHAVPLHGEPSPRGGFLVRGEDVLVRARPELVVLGEGPVERPGLHPGAEVLRVVE